MINLQMIAKSAPAMLVGGGVLLLVLDATKLVEASITGWILTSLGIILSLAWAGFFKRLF